MAVVSPFAKIQDSLPPLTPAPEPTLGFDPSALGSDQAPDLSSAPPKVVKGKPSQATAFAPLDAAQQHLSERLGRDYEKDENPYGSPTNHPGVFGKILHGLNVATGGETRRNWEEMGLQKSLQDLMGEQSKEGLQGAESENQRAEAGRAVQETADIPAKDKSLENYQESEVEKNHDAISNPSLANAYAHRVNEVLKAGGDPSTDPIVQHIGDAITSLQKQPADPTGPKTIQREIGGKPHTFAYDPKSKDYSRDEGETGEKPPTLRVETPGEARGQKNDLLKAYQPTLDSAERMNVMTDAYEKAVKNHDQQAMLNLLANHLGMTMGLQKGARMTKDIIHEAQTSQPWLQGLAAKFDKDGYLTGVTLSPPQMRQMVNLGQERYAEDAKKSRSTAHYLGAKDDGPERVPGPATMRYYLGMTSGDVNKAKNMAAEDGWTVQ